MNKLDHNTIPLSHPDQEPDAVLVDAYGDGSAVWLGLASDDPDVLNHADLEPQEARRLAFRLFVAADKADQATIDAQNARFEALTASEYVPAPIAVRTADHEYALLRDDADFAPATVPEGPIVQIRRGYLYGKIAKASSDAATAAKLIDALEQTRPTRVCIGGFVFGYGSQLTSELPDDAVCCPLTHLAKVRHVEHAFELREFETFNYVEFDRLMGKQDGAHICVVID